MAGNIALGILIGIYLLGVAMGILAAGMSDAPSVDGSSSVWKILLWPISWVGP